MSGIGHFAPAFAAKSAARTVPLWVLLVASETNDILSVLFSATGIEPRVVITTMDFHQGVRYLASTASPWSHGLFMSSIWAVLATTLAFLFYKDRRTSAMIGLVVFSHWILDFLMHSSLPLFFQDSPRVGLGLENTGTGFLSMTILDLLLLATGMAMYFRSRRQTHRFSGFVHGDIK
jgi:membrane-bound metal-dependent hydrolase YbcI (DUF457 family)